MGKRRVIKSKGRRYEVLPNGALRLLRDLPTERASLPDGAAGLLDRMLGAQRVEAT
jgi:hypothetical protein